MADVSCHQALTTRTINYGKCFPQSAISSCLHMKNQFLFVLSDKFSDGKDPCTRHSLKKEIFDPFSRRKTRYLAYQRTFVTTIDKKSFSLHINWTTLDLYSTLPYYWWGDCSSAHYHRHRLVRRNIGNRYYRNNRNTDAHLTRNYESEMDIALGYFWSRSL